MVYMRYGKLLGWGIVIYAVMFLMWSGFVTYGFIEGFAPRVTSLLILIGITIYAGLSLGFHRWPDILPYSLSWALLMATLDGVFSVPYTGWQMYFDWNIWFGYAVVAITPLLEPYFRLERYHDHPLSRSEGSSGGT